MSLKYHIKNGLLRDAAHHWDVVADLFIAEGKIVGINNAPTGFVADKTIDANGLWVLPGLVDLAVNLTDADETYAAAKGGVTTLCAYPNSQIIQQQAQQPGLSKVLPLAALTQQLKGEQLAELDELKTAGCIAASNDWFAITDTRVLRNCFQYAKTLDFPIFLTAFDESLTRNGCMHEGFTSTRLGLTGIPSSAESIGVAKALLLQQETGVQLHFCRISTTQSVDLIAQAKSQHQAVSADVAIHNLILTENDVDGFNPYVRVFPPLRAQQDQLALLRGLADGTIDAICSDHRPLTHDAKCKPFPDAEPGISGLETLFPLALQLKEKNILSERDIVALLTYKPAAILKRSAGRLDIDQSADLVLFDPKLSWQVTAETFVSRGKNTPFRDWWLDGQIVKTFLDGQMVFHTENAIINP